MPKDLATMNSDLAELNISSSRANQKVVRSSRLVKKDVSPSNMIHKLTKNRSPKPTSSIKSVNNLSIGHSSGQ